MLAMPMPREKGAKIVCDLRVRRGDFKVFQLETMYGE